MTSQLEHNKDKQRIGNSVSTMGLGDFWLQFNNGKKERMSDIKGDIRRETVEKKYQKIFDFFDTNKNGAIEGKEAEKFIEVISKFAGKDKILTKAEAASIFSELGIKTSESIDFVGFVKELSKASKKIKTSDESILPDGSRKVVTNYTNGARYTAVYYPDGELKYTIKEIPTKGTAASTSVGHSIETGPVISDASVNNTLRPVRKVEFSERAKAELRQSFGEHYEETAKNIISIIEQLFGDMTMWDRAGIDMRQAFVNGDLTEMFTAEGVKKLEEFLAKAKDDKELGQKLVEMAQNQIGTFEFHLEKDFGIKDFDFEKMENFHQTSTKYLNAKSLMQRVELLNKGLKEVNQLYQNALTKKKGVPNSDKLNSDYDKKFMEVLTEYFNGDDGVAAAFFNTMKEGLLTGTKDENEENNVLMTVLERIQQATNQTLNETLQGEKFENLESRYKAEFKEVYGTEDNTTEVENIVQTGQEIGGTIKIGAMTTIQILLSALTMGTGNAALIATMSNPFVSYLTAVGTDYALSVAGAFSSVNGLTAEKHEQILEGTLETAKFIGVGSLSAPLCRFVGNTMAKYTGKLFENGVKTTTGNITTTVVTGESYLQNLCSKSANFIGSFGTELGVFTGYEVVTQDEDFDAAAGSQTTMLSQLKVINKFLQTALGKFVQTQSAKGQQKLAEQQYQKLLKETGLDKAKIIQYETPTGTRYAGEINGIKFTGTTEAEIQAKLIYVAAQAVKEEVKSEHTDSKTSESIKPLQQRLEKGYIIDFKTQKPIKVNTEKMKIENISALDGSIGTVSIADKFGNILGSVTYGLAEINGQKTLQFEGLNSNVEGIGIGTKLINELISISKSLGAEGRLYASASPVKGINGKVTNIEFYYKLGFKAVDAAKDAEIRSYIEKGEPVPVRLNVFTEIEFKLDEHNSLIDGKYSRPLTEYDKIGNKIFELKQKNVAENPEKITELKAEIEVLRKTEPQKAEELQIVLDMFTNPTSVHNVTDAQIDAVVNYLNSHYDNVEKYLTKQSGEIGISGENLGRFGHRIKGEWSTRDKITNYINDAIIKGKDKTLLDAYNDVRDKYACRTVFDKGDYTNHPEIVKILEEGNYSDAAYRKAQLRAAEIQSQPAVDMLKEAMRKAVKEGKDLSIMRISNYTSEGGIPIFSEAQLAELKDCGIELGIDVSFIKLASEADPNTNRMIVDGATTKAQPSGYTALQINFFTKSGEIIEWQYRGELVNKFAEAEHLPYDIRTGKHPWRQYPELETLYKPIADLLAEKNMPEYAYNQLNRYFTDYYNHLRKLELGFESKEPRLEDYEKWKAKDKDGVEREYTFKFDKRLSAKSLEVLHFYGEGIKDGTITPEQALKEYNKEVKYEPKVTPKPEVKAEKQSNRTSDVMNVLNSKEGLKDIQEDIKTQIAELVTNSPAEAQESIIKSIMTLKNVKLRYGENNPDYTDAQILQIIKSVSNPDGSISPTAMERIAYIMRTGPGEDGYYIDKIFPKRVEEINLARNKDGFLDESLAEVGKKLMYAHETREEIFKLLKDENGNPVKDLIELINTDKEEHFDDGEMLLEALHALYTDGKLDLNKVNQMKELVNGGLTIYGAAGAMESGMPADIVKNMPVFAQKGLSRPDVNSVVEYLKNKNIEPTLEAVNNLIENCGDIPEFREIHIKHLLNLRGETIDKSAYNNVRYLSERINEYYKRHPELADKKPDIVSQYIKLLYIEGRKTQLTQREIMDLLGDFDTKGRPRYDIDKLVDCGVLRDIPGRSKPFSKNQLAMLQKEDIEVLKNALEKGLLSDEYMRLCCLTFQKYAIVSGGKSKLQILTELSDTELKNLWEMDWSDLDFGTAVSLAKCDVKKVNFVLDAMNIYSVPDYQKILLRDFNVDLAYKLFKEIDPHTTFPDSSVDAKVKDIVAVLFVAKPHNIDEINYMYDNKAELGITVSQIPELVSNEIKAKDIRRLAKKIGKENISKIDERALPVAIKFADFYKVNDINELSAIQKRKLRTNLTQFNANLFDPAAQQLKNLFPLLPKDQSEYCSTMRDIVNSLGIETKPLTETQIRIFNESSLELGQSLGRMSDSDFSNLRIAQEYSREDFIRTVLEKTKDLPKSEKLKVYDYFGFELHSNEANPTGYTLTGYPANINNGVKLAKIKSEETRQVVEDLRSEVIRFSENNKIKCNNPQVEKLLNQVLEALPEMHGMIGNTQHGTHNFDVMQHTLKVLQKITQEPQFKNLNESDKKVVTLAVLMHDMTKTEGKTDATHATQGSFDGFFISKKFNLTREEGIKMYTLMNMHEWLSFVNKPVTDYELNNAIKEYNKNCSRAEQIRDLTPEIIERFKQEVLTKRLQSVAFDLQQDNLFELSLMFTHADLRAVKTNDYFHDAAEMPSCATFDGKTRVFGSGKGQKVSHGQAADIYAERIRGYVDELKKTRPLTPVTRVPDSETIRSRITQINPDGSTNFKGVFVDKDGLIVIKFNDVEDWEALGFPKGTTSKGIKGTGRIKKDNGYIEESEFETGNFKFFAHALNYANQLSKFDSFALPDSDALLSVTYMERPESKYRNFNTQGIGLYVQSKYVHGGGNTDAGSGTGKSIYEFKKNYIFGGKREKDRTFTADIVKRATGMSDEQYVQFYEKNKNKTWEEVEPIDGSDPVEFRNKLIKAYAEGIVSNERGDRAYDEYYVTNPEEPMFAWVYASDKNEKIGANPLEFLHRNNRTDKESKIGRIGHTAIRPVEERTQFLREYCLNRNKVMIVFGD